jgi:hypothetical protein
MTRAAVPTKSCKDAVSTGSVEHVIHVRKERSVAKVRPSYMIRVQPDQHWIAGGHPCSNCNKRGHPNVCIFIPQDAQVSRARRRTRPPTNEQGHPAPAENSGTQKESTQSMTWPRRDQDHGVTPRGSLNTAQSLTPTSTSTTSLGEFSTASFVRDRVRDRLIQRGCQLSSDVRAGLALDDDSPHSLIDGFSSKAQKTISRLMSLSPSRDEFIRYERSSLSVHTAPTLTSSTQILPLVPNLHFAIKPRC